MNRRPAHFGYFLAITSLKMNALMGEMGLEDIFYTCVYLGVSGNLNNTLYMKIFISHSSKDKWAARRISQDLENLGAETFLDEKDIRSGHSIDDSIKKHLKDSDHFLILISPSSIKSEWVLIELGGALALEKIIIPVLLYVGMNELPNAINLRLARDINDIDRYYSELNIKKTDGLKSTITRKVYPKTTKSFKNKFTINDKVKITNTIPEDVYRETGLIADWEPVMDSTLGQVGIIKIVFGDGSYGLDINTKVYAEEWLTKIE